MMLTVSNPALLRDSLPLRGGVSPFSCNCLELTTCVPLRRRERSERGCNRYSTVVILLGLPFNIILNKIDTHH